MDLPELHDEVVMSQVPLRSSDGNGTTAPSTSNIPVGYKNRKMTDKYFLIIYIVCLIVTLTFAVYILNKSDTTKLEEANEEGSYPYHHDNLKVKKGILREIASVFGSLAFTLMITIGLCIGIIAGFRFAPLFAAWCTLSGTFIVFFICSMILIIWGYDGGQLLPITILMTVALAVGIFIMRSRISDISILYGEASRAIFQMPATFVVSIVAMVVSLIITLIIFRTIAVYTLTSVTAENHEHQLDDYKIGALLLASIMTYWSFEIILGVQYLIVSGAVINWYFNREKNPQLSPVYNSFRVTFRYHVGTAVLGSVMVGLLHFFRINVLLATLIRFTCGGCVRGSKTCCLIFTKVPYTVTAMKGTPFFKSNSEAQYLLHETIWMTRGIFKYTNYISAMAYMFVVCLSSVISFYFLLEQTNVSFELTVISTFWILGISWVACLTTLGMLDCIVNTLLMCLSAPERPLMTPGMEKFVNVVKT